jgi:hypothetical protein
LSIIQHIYKHYSFHLQGECVVAGQIWQPYILQAIGCEFDLMKLIGGVEEQAATQWENSMWFRKRD